MTYRKIPEQNITYLLRSNFGNGKFYGGCSVRPWWALRAEGLIVIFKNKEGGGVIVDNFSEGLKIV